MIPKRQFQLQGALLVCGLAIALAGCSTSSIHNAVDSMPASMGGLTADTPERPADPAAYPAVHDMPSPRPNTTLTAEEQIRLENDLTATRTRQEIATGTAPPAAKRSQPAAAPTPRIVPAVSTNTIY
jgi:hypothetical protein